MHGGYVSKPRISIYLEVDTAAHGQTIRTAIQNRLAGKDIFETHVFDFGSVNDIGSDAVWGVLECRFNSKIDRDDIKDWLKDQVQNHPQIKNWILKAEIKDHLCSHDDAEVKDCRTTEYFEWSK